MQKSATIGTLVAWVALACGGNSATPAGDADASADGGGGGGGGTCEQLLLNCSSHTFCNDGCNTCTCSQGQWLCTARACVADGGGIGGSDAGDSCTPLPGCSSNTLCNDGCNTCSCNHGAWACTERACPADAATGACESDDDCVFRENSGCCGACLAKTDPVPPPLGCRIACPASTPSCLCTDHHCATGTLALQADCDQARDLCSPGMKICLQCGGPQLPDGGNCSPPVCTYAEGACPLYP
jgi:hypothetical protein